MRNMFEYLQRFFFLFHRSSKLPEKIAASLPIDEFDEASLPPGIVNFTMGSLWDGTICSKCSAYLFKHEPKGFCCLDGKVKIDLPHPPDILKDLLKNSTNFKTNIRSYNNSLAMASLGLDKEIVNDGYSPSLKFQGSLYHNIGPLKAQDGAVRKFAQLYIHDGSMEDEVSDRLKVTREGRDLKADILKRLQDMLHIYNPFVQTFKALGEIPDEEIKDVKFILRKDKRPAGEHERRFNLPDKNEIAVISINESKEPADVLIRMRDDGALHRIPDTHPAFDPLRYTLLFPDGQQGWKPGLLRTDGKRLTALEFYNYMLQVRDRNQFFNSILRSRRLCQEYMCTSFHRMDRMKMHWVETHQKEIRAEKYSGVYDALHGQDDLSKIGQKIILPGSITCSPRWYQNKFQDAMGICRDYGKPTLFITFSAHASCKEVTSSIYEGEVSHDRPDIVNRAFQSKRRELKYDIKNNMILGQTIANVDVIEFQKRNLPHTHMMIWLREQDVPRTPEEYDKFTCSELPDPSKNPELFKLVVKFHIHGPCGKNNPDSPCMKDGKCSKGYPKPFQKHTSHGQNNYPLYRRRHPNDGGFTAKIKISAQNNQDFVVDNSWIIPYNPTLLLKYQAHINVEIVASVLGIKYLFKYFHKGPDRVMVELMGKIVENEVKTFVNARYSSSNEAHWKISGFEMSTMYPSVQKLALHLPNEQTVIMANKDFQGLEGPALTAAVTNVLQASEKTTLTQFFKLCRDDPRARDLTYPNVYKFYKWENKEFHWRKQNRCINDGDTPEDGAKSKTIGRIPVVALTSRNKELYFMRMLLYNVKGPQSFEDLKTVENEVCETYQAACIKVGLFEGDDEIEKSLREAASIKFGSALRHCFVTLMVYAMPSNPRELYETFKRELCEDYCKKDRISEPTEEMINDLLLELQDIFDQHGCDMVKQFSLPEPDKVTIFTLNTFRQFLSKQFSLEVSVERMRYVLAEAGELNMIRSVMYNIVHKQKYKRMRVEYLFDIEKWSKIFV